MSGEWGVGEFAGRVKYRRTPGIVDFTDFRFERQLGEQRHIIAGGLDFEVIATPWALPMRAIK